MKLFDYLKEELENNKKIVETPEEIVAEDAPMDMSDNKEYEVGGINADSHYYNMKDPKTGFRYDIPMLSPQDPVYYFKYVRYMKLKEQNEETFNRVMNWE